VFVKHPNNETTDQKQQYHFKLQFTRYDSLVSSGRRLMIAKNCVNLNLDFNSVQSNYFVIVNKSEIRDDALNIIMLFGLNYDVFDLKLNLFH